MNKLFLFAILGILLTSCLTEQPRFVLVPPVEGDEPVAAVRAFVITDYKDKDLNQEIPEWANRLFEGGVSALETMEIFMDKYVFIARSEGNNFNALNLWATVFNAELDFPRLAASRVNARFSAGVHFPDTEFGPLYEALIRSVSDARWTGISKKDDFWIKRNFFAEGEIPESEDWEFLILLTIEKSHFISQLNSIFQNPRPSSLPTERQWQAYNRVVDSFFDGF